MSSVVRRIAAVLIAAAAIVALAALSRVPYRSEPDGRSLLRLSWRARGETLARCRRATPAELEGVPAHMRQPTICEGAHVAPYRLRVVIDGAVRHDARATGSGIPGDRPMYILEEFALSPGRHHLEVRFEKESNGETGNQDDGNDAVAREESARRAIPPLLGIDTIVTVPSHAILLVTYESEHRQLVVHRSVTAPH